MKGRVYRLYAGDGALLYVGMGCDPATRLYNHRKYRPWGSEIARAEYDEWMDWKDAWKSETEQIRALNPRYNIAKRAPGEPSVPVIISLSEGRLHELKVLAASNGMGLSKFVNFLIASKLGN